MRAAAARLNNQRRAFLLDDFFTDCIWKLIDKYRMNILKIQAFLDGNENNTRVSGRILILTIIEKMMENETLVNRDIRGDVQSLL